MKLNREALLKHLQRISCGGQVDEVVFSEGFATAALTPDHLLCVIAPSIPKADHLKNEVGVGRLGFFMKALGALSGVGNDAVEVKITVQEHRLLLNEDERGKQRLLTANPSTIGTRLEEETQEKLLAGAPDGEGIPLTRALVEGIQNTFALYKAEEIELHIGGKKGKYTVGNENSDVAEFPDKSLKHGGKKADDYSLLFGQHLIDVLGVISNYSEASLCLGGPNTMILIKDGEYRYILSPRSKGAEAEAEDEEECGEDEE